MSDKARFFGECPQYPFNGGTSFITVGTKFGEAQAKGYASILILTDTIFATLQFSNPVSGSGDLAGVTIPAGVILYGVRSYQVTSGSGIAYHSHA